MLTREEKNKRAPATAKADVDYLLTTKLFCGLCERMMIGESGTSHTGDKHYYYKCAGAKRKLGCKKKSVKKDFIERAAVILTVNRVLRDEEISRIADSIHIKFKVPAISTASAKARAVWFIQIPVVAAIISLQKGFFYPFNG